MSQVVSLPDSDRTVNHAEIFVAIELSRSSWIVAVHAPALGEKVSNHQFAGGDTPRLLALIDRMRRQVEQAGHTDPIVCCCYEAGYDGFGCIVCLSPSVSTITFLTPPACSSIDVRSVPRPIIWMRGVCSGR